ncbi:PHB depolymerase family esterase [Streptomyces sp. TRM68416]|uniref:extracellular catalytic domain type 1 short-chain-length polyhydroxyalkanoate depolymerase n=1 Tax=Streptomyces sp. TRM68416 TaxID=2758412 RepID=UPI00166214EF|nr:PHB depolymerase family esterase [Streptomyces sp. TRM68416]MBD0842248.1 PHB depolymerase family esterase [Streptomyces sp. TRM68416]
MSRKSKKRSVRDVLVALLMAISPLFGALVLTGASAATASAASLAEVTGFGSNPGNLRMYVYKPDSAPARPAVLVAVHYCTGTGPTFYNNTEFARLADQHGFIVIYPDANVSGQCFDVSSPQALRHDGGSDPMSIAQMVRYTVQNMNADADRVYVTGASSGAMTTNVLLGAYPDVFKAGAAFMGVPFGCFATTDGSGWNTACATGQISKTPQEWGDLVRNAYPGYTGPRPRMQLWHGTEDDALRYPNFGEEIKQWTNVLGVSQTPVFTDSPEADWTRTRYGSTGAQAPVEAISIQGAGHSLPATGMAARAIAFFGLDGSGGATTGPLRAIGADKCLDVPGFSQTNGVQTQIWDCHGGTNQTWTRTPAKQLTVYGGTKCLDAAGTTPGAKVVLWDCNGGAQQQWNLNPNGTITSAQSGLCLDVTGAATTNGTTVGLWNCSGTPNQQWRHA